MHRTSTCAILPILLLFSLAACTPAPVPTATASPTLAPASQTAAPSLLPSLTQAPATATETRPPSPTGPPTETATPDPYALYTIDTLASREYGGGSIEIVEVMAETGWFTRYLIRYPSDGLWIYGFLNVPIPEGPAGPGPYPVVIALHGYIDPSIYHTLDYTTGYADALARAGYFVLHPNLRGYRPSDDGENLFRVGMAIDVLNLIALVQAGAAESWLLANVDTAMIGLWGHSMGGGISTRVITVTDRVQAAVLYAPMSGDERQNFEAINGWSGGARGLEELAFPERELARISPMYFFDRITAAVSIHHGRADELVPLGWSIATCNAMLELDLDVRCHYYDAMPHTFFGAGNDQLIADMIAFFDETLKEE
ncbi:MAG TPA: alpha/beta fold hydrolase [Anaerolineales bacterium]|nr:alpha/beta fold hydrolase [Anaerolineales bacterium]